MITEGTGAGYTYMGCSAAAGKTGTSEDTSDAWFAGYTPLYSTAVWVGHPQSREPTGYGGPTAGPIWASFMSAAANGDCPEFEVPASLPELEGLDSDHTRSYSESSSDFGPYEEEYEESGDRGRKTRRRRAATRAAKRRRRQPNRRPTPAPAPAPLRAPAPSEQVGGGVAAPHRLKRESINRSTCLDRSSAAF